MLPLSAFLELAAYLFFYRSVRAHRARGALPMQTWMRLVGASTIGFMVTLLVNCAILVHLAIVGNTPALGHLLDQQFTILSIWGLVIPTIWAFNTRWLPVFAGLRQPHGNRLLLAYGFSILGILTIFAGFWSIASVAFLFAALLSIDALHVWEPREHEPKLVNVHPSFVVFLRLAYAWLLVSCFLALLAVPFDHAGGIWGASRHALTVGFVAGMVFVIGQRILPAFCGMRILWSMRLMFWSLLLLDCGCFLRVASEPLAYEDLWTPAWKILPISAVIELAAVGLFAMNIAVTLLKPPAHLRRATKIPFPAKGVA